MRIQKKILFIWILLLPLCFLAANVTNEGRLDLSEVINNSVRLLLAIVTFCIFRAEDDVRNKAIFFNFFLFFGPESISYYLYSFLSQTLLAWDRFAGLYQYQYDWAVYFLLLAVCVVYVVVDSVVERARVYQKYLWTLLVVGSMWGYLFYPYFENPKYLYTTSDIKDYKVLDTALESLKKEGKYHATVGEISSSVRLYVHQGDGIVVELSGPRKDQRIAELLPYMDGRNYTLLFFKPLYLNCVYLSVLCLGYILFFFAYHYVNDPPKKAYVEKIVLLLLLYCALEALHLYAFWKAVESSDFAVMAAFGRYLSIGVEILLLWVFLLRLRFILSAEGKFYERRLMNDPTQITRWRDMFDESVIRQFLNPKLLERRFLVRRGR